jgi:hypothetical protein
MSALPIGSQGVRIAGLATLVLGILIWVSPDVTATIRPVHMLAGLLVMVSLLVLAALGLRAGVPVLPLVAIAWALVLPVFGMTQESMTALPRVAIQAGHLAVGIVAIGLGEALSAKIGRPKGVRVQAS